MITRAPACSDRSLKSRWCAAVAARPLCSLLALAAAGAAAQSVGTGNGLGFGYGDYDSRTGGAREGGTRGGGDADESGGRAFYIVPTLAANATLTNNVSLSATDKRSDLVLALIPGIRIGGQSARVRGFLDYSLTGSFYARNEASANFANALREIGIA